jgi:hypothetical protein
MLLSTLKKNLINKDVCFDERTINPWGCKWFHDNEIYIDASPYAFNEYSNELLRNTTMGGSLANRSRMPTLHCKANSN